MLTRLTVQVVVAVVTVSLVVVMVVVADAGSGWRDTEKCIPVTRLRHWTE